MNVPKRRLASRLQYEQEEDKPLNPLSFKLQCFSVACLDMPQLEFGDKIVLPPKVLLELQCFKIPTPLLFMLQPSDTSEEDSAQIYRQYCSVQEFSAPDGQVFLPYWLMQNLHLSEGGAVVATSIVNIPRGIYCRLQPESSRFLDLAAEVGPKLLMETAMRRYSILSTNSTIVIEYGDIRYYLRVAELKPAPVISLCGDVDLETDFMPPERSNPKRPSTGSSVASNEDTRMHVETPDSSAFNGKFSYSDTSSLNYGRRLRDGGYVENEKCDSVTTKVKSPICFQKAQQNIREKQSQPVATDAVADAVDSAVLATQIRLAQGSFSKPGHTLGTAKQTQSSQTTVGKDEELLSINTLEKEQNTLQDRSDSQSNASNCNLCLATVSSLNWELHTLRCAKNPTYHKFKCLVCQENVLRVHENQHLHCPDCNFLCESTETMEDHQQYEHESSCKCKDCGKFFTRAELQNHVDSNQCELALVSCLLCGLAFKRKEMKNHSNICSSRTEKCEKCKLYIKITDFDFHRDQCEISQEGPSRLTTSSNQLECVYCFQGSFVSISDVEHHVINDCRIAKSFTTSKTFPIECNNQNEAKQVETGDLEDVCVAITRPLLAQGRMRRRSDIDVLSSLSSRKLNSLITSTSARSQSGSSRLLSASRPGKLKPRMNPQLRTLSHQAPTSAIRLNIVNTSDLCISNAGYTLHHFILPQSRAQAKVRRRPGRLDKLP